MTKQIALVGNPNSGKTTLFNLLTDTNQRVGNWPEVTVEKKSGLIKHRKQLLLQDLPGIYSLSPYTAEEAVARDYLITDQPAAILNVVDATNLERNLYLTLQLLEMGMPVLIALNMTDVLKQQGKTVNSDQLSYQLGVPVQPISAWKKLGIPQLLHEVEKTRQPVTNRYTENTRKWRLLMPTLILFLIIAILFILAIRSLAKGECSCDCSIKQAVEKRIRIQNSSLP